MIINLCALECSSSIQGVKGLIAFNMWKIVDGHKYKTEATKDFNFDDFVYLENQTDHGTFYERLDKINK